MSHRIRSAAVALALAAATTLLTSCSMFTPAGPSRGDDGQVTESSVVPTTELLTGDCFSYVEEYPEHERINLMPCADEHGYIVIAQGALTEQDVADAGSLQNAVSASCGEPFATYKAAATEGAKPTQEFLVTVSTVEGQTLQNYSCVATDGAVSAAD
jgi:hypothetical protein